MSITRILLVVGKEKAIIQSRKQVHISAFSIYFSRLHVSPPSIYLAVLFLRTLVMINHEETLVSGKRYVVTGIVAGGLKGNKSVNRT